MPEPAPGAGACARETCGPSCVLGSAGPGRVQPGRSMVRAAGRVVLVAVCVGGGAVLVLLLTAVPGYGRTTRGAVALQWVSRWVLRAAGIRPISRGAPRSGPSLVVANHVSWLDVLVLAAAAPMLPVAKSDVRGWPLIGTVASRVGALFVRRDRWRDLPDAVQQVTAALRRGHRVQVFPESTTRCGTALNPFRHAAFQAAVDAAVVISPVALGYRDRAGRPTSAAAFVGADSLLTSLWRTLRAGPLTVRVQWLPVIPAIAGSGHRSDHRAAAAARSERSIARALGQPVVGRPRRPATGSRPLPALVAVPSVAESVVPLEQSRVAVPRVA